MTILQPQIVIVGSLNMDIVIEADRFPMPGETILGKNIRFLPGGKGANQAVAAARLGASTTMIGAVGDDSFGKELIQALQAEGIRTDTIKINTKASTGIANITVCSGDNSIVVVPGANHTLFADDIREYEQIIASADIVLLQLEIPLETVIAAAQLAKRLGKTVILNPAPAQPLPEQLLRLVDYITPNRTELSLLTGINTEGSQLTNAMRALRSKGTGQVITTLGSEGSAYLNSAGSLVHMNSYPVQVVDTTGAGDSYNAALAFSLARQQSLEKSVDFAAKVSALAVTKFGAQTGMPTMKEVLSLDHLFL